MANRNFRYDHPAYLAPVFYSGQIAAGAATAQRFSAICRVRSMASPERAESRKTPSQSPLRG